VVMALAGAATQLPAIDQSTAALGGTFEEQLCVSFRDMDASPRDLTK
jgi:hypothetical protein